jgi:hypothetical protein
VDRDLAGRLTNVIFIFYLFSRAQRKEQQANWAVPTPLHTLLTEIARLADQQQQQCPESKRAADLSRVCLQALFLCPSLLQLLPCTLFFFTLGVDSPTRTRTTTNNAAAAPASRKTATTFLTTALSRRQIIRRRTAAK